MMPLTPAWEQAGHAFSSYVGTSKIIGNNFAESGAIDLLGPRYGLPKSIGVHQSYWLWGPRNYTGEIMIVLGDRPEALAQLCNSVEVVARLNKARFQGFAGFAVSRFSRFQGFAGSKFEILGLVRETPLAGWAHAEAL